MKWAVVMTTEEEKGSRVEQVGDGLKLQSQLRLESRGRSMYYVGGAGDEQGRRASREQGIVLGL